MKKRKLYCICNAPEKRPMIGCDRCKGWFHYKCVGVTKSTVPSKQWFCPPCTNLSEVPNFSRLLNCMKTELLDTIKKGFIEHGSNNVQNGLCSENSELKKSIEILEKTIKDQGAEIARLKSVQDELDNLEGGLRFENTKLKNFIEAQEKTSADQSAEIALLKQSLQEQNEVDNNLDSGLRSENTKLKNLLEKASADRGAEIALLNKSLQQKNAELQKLIEKKNDLSLEISQLKESLEHKSKAHSDELLNLMKEKEALIQKLEFERKRKRLSLKSTLKA